MLSQTFRPPDLASILALVVLEALLSADNALVLAIMVRHLEPKEQKHALFYGLGGAFVFRLIAIVFASVVLRQWWLQGLGAAYLIGVAMRHFRRGRKVDGRSLELKKASFWWTVAAVELTDIAFAIDSVLAGVTFIDNRTSKLWVVYFGAVIGIVLLRFAATQLSKLMDRYPSLDHVAYVIVGWVGIKLLFLTVNAFEVQYPKAWNFDFPEMPSAVFWGVLAACAIVGTALAARRPPGPESL